MLTGYKTAEPDKAINRSYLWLGSVLLAAVLAFWVWYPETGLVTQGAESAQTGQQEAD